MSGARITPNEARLAAQIGVAHVGDNTGFVLRQSATELMCYVEALRTIFQHAYDPETHIEDVMADFDRMREIARVALGDLG